MALMFWTDDDGLEQLTFDFYPLTFDLCPRPDTATAELDDANSRSSRSMDCRFKVLFHLNFRKLVSLMSRFLGRDIIFPGHK